MKKTFLRGTIMPLFCLLFNAAMAQKIEETEIIG
jgi:hypothetical protein